MQGGSRNTYGLWTFNESCKFADFSKIWKCKKLDTICVAFAKMKLAGRSTSRITVHQ